MGELSGAGVPLSQVGRHPARIKFREVQGPLSRAAFPFPAGGWQSLPSRSSLRITLGPSAYGYYRTGNFWSPHREREKALQWQEPSPSSLAFGIGLSRAPPLFIPSDLYRSCGPFLRRMERPACGVSFSRGFQELRWGIFLLLPLGRFVLRPFSPRPLSLDCVLHLSLSHTRSCD